MLSVSRVFEHSCLGGFLLLPFAVLLSGLFARALS